MVLPVGLLMIEHRLIERMISLLDKEIGIMKQNNAADIVFVEGAIDFIRTYADQCHHGKEEDILFRDLLKKEISDKHKRIIEELMSEHVLGRKTVKNLEAAKNDYKKGTEKALASIIGNCETLVSFYPKHIEKEDKHFFLEVMDYFDNEEKEKMLDEYSEFDRSLIHEKYKDVVEAFEEKEEVPELEQCETAGTGEHARIFNEDMPCKEQEM